MKETVYLVIGKGGLRGTRKTKPSLKWDEVALSLALDIPDELFRRPQLEATITVDKDKVHPDQILPDVIINTKELIEQQTGAKIEFRVLPVERESHSQESGDSDVPAGSYHSPDAAPDTYGPTARKSVETGEEPASGQGGLRQMTAPADTHGPRKSSVYAESPTSQDADLVGDTHSHGGVTEAHKPHKLEDGRFNSSPRDPEASR